MSMNNAPLNQNVLGKPDVSRLQPRRAAILPLPKGEGRGEGKGDVQITHTRQHYQASPILRQVLECGSPLPLFPRGGCNRSKRTSQTGPPCSPSPGGEGRGEGELKSN